MARTITLAHSPDSDDAFMFYALAKGKVDTRGLTFKHVLDDIETLNRKAIEGTYEVTAVSFHAYYKIRDRYRLMTAGASVGDGYGPMIVSKRPLTHQDLDEADQQPAGGIEGVLGPAAEADGIDQRLHGGLEEPALQGGKGVCQPIDHGGNSVRGGMRSRRGIADAGAGSRSRSPWP